MPWGRWLQESNEQTADAIERMKNDPNSPGNQFKAQAEKIGTQIANIQVGTIAQSALPNFSGVVVGSFGTASAVVSSPYTFSPPSPKATSCLAIVNFRITSSSGLAPSMPTMKVNGMQFANVETNPMRPPTVNTQGYYSVMGNVSLNPGQTVTLEYGAVMTNTTTPNTLTFDLSTVWLAFYGGL